MCINILQPHLAELWGSTRRKNQLPKIVAQKQLVRRRVFN